MALRHQSKAFYTLLAVSIVATLVYGYFGYKDTKNIVENIYQEQELLTQTLIEQMSSTEEFTPIMIFASLEADTMVARNKRASSALATRTWLRYSLTIVGLILAIYGSAFVLGQITISEPAQGEAGAGGVTVKFSTTSPGLILAALGVVVIIIPVIIPQEITTTDAATYGNFSPLLSESAAPDAPSNLSDDEIRKRLGIKE